MEGEPKNMYPMAPQQPAPYYQQPGQAQPQVVYGQPQTAGYVPVQQQVAVNIVGSGATTLSPSNGCVICKHPISFKWIHDLILQSTYVLFLDWIIDKITYLVDFVSCLCIIDVLDDTGRNAFPEESINNLLQFKANTSLSASILLYIHPLCKVK